MIQLYQSICKNGEIEKENIHTALKDFLLYYQQVFGYQLKDVISFIEDKDRIKGRLKWNSTV